MIKSNHNETSEKSNWRTFDMKSTLKRFKYCGALVAQACNLSYLGGWDWEDLGSRSALPGSLWEAIWTSIWAQWCMPVTPSYAGGWDQEDGDLR
jgi:hypothetical protein